jgi:hypothetical protein
MKTFKVSLTKSFIVSIAAEDEYSAARFTEFFTSDVTDLSTEDDRKNRNFVIEEIECIENEVVSIPNKSEEI